MGHQLHTGQPETLGKVGLISCPFSRRPDALTEIVLPDVFQRLNVSCPALRLCPLDLQGVGGFDLLILYPGTPDGLIDPLRCNLRLRQVEILLADLVHNGLKMRMVIGA